MRLAAYRLPSSNCWKASRHNAYGRLAPSASRNLLTGAAVTGYLFRNGDQQIDSNNQFDRAVTPIPSFCTAPQLPTPEECALS